MRGLGAGEQAARSPNDVSWRTRSQATICQSGCLTRKFRYLEAFPPGYVFQNLSESKMIKHANYCIRMLNIIFLGWFFLWKIAGSDSSTGENFLQSSISSWPNSAVIDTPRNFSRRESWRESSNAISAGLSHQIACISNKIGFPHFRGMTGNDGSRQEKTSFVSGRGRKIPVSMRVRALIRLLKFFSQTCSLLFLAFLRGFMENLKRKNV